MISQLLDVTGRYLYLLKLVPFFCCDSNSSNSSNIPSVVDNIEINANKLFLTKLIRLHGATPFFNCNSLSASQNKAISLWSMDGRCHSDLGPQFVPVPTHVNPLSS